MILVKIELHSANTGKVTEIGRMEITNTGLGTQKRGEYDVAILRRGTTDKVQRRGMVRDYPRLSYTVWELVRRALVAGLGKWPIHPGEPEEFDEQARQGGPPAIDWTSPETQKAVERIAAEIAKQHENQCLGCAESFDTGERSDGHKLDCKYSK